MAQLPARPTSAAAATLSGSKGQGPSESSGRIPALPAASSVAARVAPLVMAPGVFDTATAKPRVFPALAALPAGVVGEVSDRRTLRDEKATTVQLGAAVGDVKLPGQIVTVARPGLAAKVDGSLERGGDLGGDREGSIGPAVRIAAV